MAMRPGRTLRPGGSATAQCRRPERQTLTTRCWHARLGGLTARPAVRWGVEAVALCTILGLGAALRADDFMVVPRLTDETAEVLYGLRLVREGTVPLVGVQPYTGGLFTYLVGLMFMLVGPKIEAGRLVALAAGTLTLLPTWLLARDLATSLWDDG